MLLRSWLVALFCFLSFLPLTNGFAESSFTEQPDVQAFIQMMVKKHHFKKAELVALFDTVKIRPKIIRQFKAPMEQQPWYLYERLFVNEWRIQQGVAFWRKHAKELANAEKKYGVPASIIVATIGVETKYGQKMGEHRVLDALSNLAFSDSKRAPFFRRELTEFLLLTRENHLNPSTMLGSYAGAIGQPQFMPSSYRYYAANFSGKGKVDLINSAPDAICSVANYYKEHGWTTDEPVAVPTSLSSLERRSIWSFGKTKKLLSSSELPNYGIVNPMKDSKKGYAARVIELKDYHDTQYWLGFHNFEVIKRYNPSDLYAMAVFQLSHYLSTLKEKANDV